MSQALRIATMILILPRVGVVQAIIEIPLMTVNGTQLAT